MADLRDGLKTCIKLSGFSHRQIAEEAEMTEQEIGDVVNKRRHLGASELFSICSVIGFTVNEVACISSSNHIPARFTQAPARPKTTQEGSKGSEKVDPTEEFRLLHQSCLEHYRIDNPEKWPKGFEMGISDQPIKFVRCLEVLPQRINIKKKTRIIIDYDPDFPYAVLQTIEEDQPEIKEQEQPGGKVQND